MSPMLVLEDFNVVESINVVAHKLKTAAPILRTTGYARNEHEIAREPGPALCERRAQPGEKPGSGHR